MSVWWFIVVIACLALFLPMIIRSGVSEGIDDATKRSEARKRETTITTETYEEREALKRVVVWTDKDDESNSLTGLGMGLDITVARNLQKNVFWRLINRKKIESHEIDGKIIQDDPQIYLTEPELTAVALAAIRWYMKVNRQELQEIKNDLSEWKCMKMEENEAKHDGAAG